jgi:superfamily II DNA/RNA helicase
MPPEIQRIADTFLHNPERVEVSRPATTAVTVRQLLVASSSDPAGKRETLRRLLRSENLKNAIVFCNRKREVAVLHRSLVKHGFSAVALHGDMDQPARTAALDQFRTGEASLLVASDVAARGLDIPAVSHVFNFDVPHHADDYVHRIGRTGRAGRSGTAISIVGPIDQKNVAAIEKLTAQTIEWVGPRSVSASEDTSEDRRPRRQARGASGGRERGRSGTGHSAPKTNDQPKTEQPSERPSRHVAQLEHARLRREQPAAQEPADVSHLPAFLLRPVRVKA